jgi:hypothetical protein
MVSRPSRILILCKTYPSPSGKHVETSCVAGMEEDGSLVRLYPIPFRLIESDRQFKKWQWITAQIEKARKDHRPESHKVFVDTIQCAGEPLSTRDAWRNRREQIAKLVIYDDFAALEAARQSDGTTLGLIRPSRVLGLDIAAAAKPNWSEQETSKLLQQQHQPGLFEPAEAKPISPLKKIPFEFHYRYACKSGIGEREYRHKIVDWEAGALYLNCRARYGDAWGEAFRRRLEEGLPAADLTFLMGTIHRFPDSVADREPNLSA